MADDEAAQKQRLSDLVPRADRSDITLGETVRLTSVIRKKGDGHDSA